MFTTGAPPQTLTMLDDGAHGDGAVFSGGQIVGRDGGGGGAVGGFDLHAAARGRAQIADAGGEAREGVQRVAEFIKAQRLHVVFEIGCGLRVVAFDEGAELRGRHRQRAAAVHRVFEAHHQLAPQRVRHGVERFDIADLERHAQLQMVVQVGADTGQIVRDGNAVALQ